MDTIIEVMKSLVNMNGWEVVRFDLQRVEVKYLDPYYVGYLTILDDETTVNIVIRKNGSFEILEK